jgi:hypothetical protein
MHEVPSFTGVVLFREENEVRTVNVFKVGSEGVEGVKEINNSRKGGGASSFKERWAKSIRTRTGVGVHSTNGITDFLGRERDVETFKLQGTIGVEAVQRETLVGVTHTQPTRL